MHPVNEQRFARCFQKQAPVIACLSFFYEALGPNRLAALLGNLSSLALDYTARFKVGGIHLNFFIFRQLPVLPPTYYSTARLDFAIPRVLELTYTSHNLAPFARDLGYDGPPFTWDEDRPALLRAELDAFYVCA